MKLYRVTVYNTGSGNEFVAISAPDRGKAMSMLEASELVGDDTGSIILEPDTSEVYLHYEEETS